jgi:hypothetical protein
MLEIVRSLITSVNGPNTGRKKILKKKELKEAPKPKELDNYAIIPPAPALFPDMEMVKFDEMQADLLEITQADKFSFTGFQLGWMSVIGNVWMFGQNFHVGKKEEKMGDEKANGWLYQTVLMASPGVTLSGRYSSEMTSMGLNYDSIFGPVSLNINLSEQPDKHLWDLSFITAFSRACIHLRTQSFLYHSFSWATWLWDGVYIGTELQMLPWLPHAEPQSRMKIAANYSFGPSRHTYFSYATGNLGKTTKEIGIGYVRQFSDIFQLACSYDLTATQDQRWKSVLKLGYLLQSESEKAVHQLRGFIDSAWKVVCIGDYPIGEGLSLNYSAKFDFLKNIYDLGVGVAISPNVQTEEDFRRDY